MSSGRTLIYGLGESGLAALNALLSTGTPAGELRAADARTSEELRAATEGLGVETRLGAGPEVLEKVDRVVTSPGITPRDPVLVAAEERGTPVISEVALGLEVLGGEATVVAVTGTNGKTTVVDIIHSVLESAKVPHAVAGNSWTALCGKLDEARRSGLLVLEVSSFQLHYLPDAGFEVAALLNVRPDHLNWHDSFEEYVRDKLRIFEGQKPEDLALVSAADPVASGGREISTSLQDRRRGRRYRRRRRRAFTAGLASGRDRGTWLYRSSQLRERPVRGCRRREARRRPRGDKARPPRLPAQAAPVGGRSRTRRHNLRGRLQSHEPGGGGGGARRV